MMRLVSVKLSHYCDNISVNKRVIGLYLEPASDFLKLKLVYSMYQYSNVYSDILNYKNHVKPIIQTFFGAMYFSP